jgi:hypothetical protein
VAEEAGVDVNTIGTNPRASRESQIREVLAGDLRHRPWSVTAEPVFGSTRPDFLVEDGKGNAYIIEVKLAPGGAHFGSVAQIAAFREAAAAKLPQDSVGAMLVLVGQDAQELQSTGQDYGVQVIGTSSNVPSEVAKTVVESLGAVLDGGAHAT